MSHSFVLSIIAPEPQHPHPQAPADLQKAFGNFLKKFEASTSSAAEKPTKSKSKDAYEEFWEAPSYLWKPRALEIEDAEIDAVMVRGPRVHPPYASSDV